MLGTKIDRTSLMGCLGNVWWSSKHILDVFGPSWAVLGRLGSVLEGSWAPSLSSILTEDHVGMMTTRLAAAALKALGAATLALKPQQWSEPSLQGVDGGRGRVTVC